MRLDLLLIRRYPELSRRKARDVIEKGQVDVGSERVREPGRDVPETAAVSFDANRKALPKARSTLPILHEDEHVIVVDKPAGLLSVPTAAGMHEDTVLARVKDYARRLNPHRGYAERVHRLDRDTTGALAFALSREARARADRRLSSSPHRAALSRARAGPARGRRAERWTPRFARNGCRADAAWLGPARRRNRLARTGRCASGCPARRSWRSSSRPDASTRSACTSPTRASRSSATPVYGPPVHGRPLAPPADAPRRAARVRPPDHRRPRRGHEPAALRLPESAGDAEARRPRSKTEGYAPACRQGATRGSSRGRSPGHNPGELEGAEPAGHNPGELEGAEPAGHNPGELEGAEPAGHNPGVLEGAEPPRLRESDEQAVSPLARPSSP